MLFLVYKSVIGFPTYPRFTADLKHSMWFILTYIVEKESLEYAKFVWL